MCEEVFGVGRRRDLGTKKVSFQYHIDIISSVSALTLTFWQHNITNHRSYTDDDALLYNTEK